MTLATTPSSGPRNLPTVEELAQLNERFESATAHEIIAWAVETYSPRIAVTSSFGASSGAILHLISEVSRDVPVIFLQTHYHFEETLRFRDDVAERYGLVVENWEARGGRPGFLSKYPDDLNKRENLEGFDIPRDAEGKVRTGVDLCCWMNKVEPMERALKHRLAYFTSLRRDGGSEHRARTKIVEAYNVPHRDEPLVKINPLANWTKRDLWGYIHENGIPFHPLWPMGYKSIGCAPCTRPVGDGQDERAGRWQGQGKVECGIHTARKPIDYSI